MYIQQTICLNNQNQTPPRVDFRGTARHSPPNMAWKRQSDKSLSIKVSRKLLCPKNPQSRNIENPWKSLPSNVPGFLGVCCFLFFGKGMCFCRKACVRGTMWGEVKFRKWHGAKKICLFQRGSRILYFVELSGKIQLPASSKWPFDLPNGSLGRTW